MNVKISICLAAAFAAFVSPLCAEVADDSAASRRETVAVFARADNDAVKQYLSAFEADLCSKINGEGFSAMSRKVVLSELSKIGVENSDSVKAAQIAKIVAALKDGAGAGSDEIWISASMLAVTKMLGADYLVDARLSSIATDERVYSDMGADTVSTRTVMRASYALYESGAGRGTAGNTVVADKTVRQSKNLAVADSDIPNVLVDDLAAQIAQSLRRDKDVSGSFVAKGQKDYEVQIFCFIEGMRFPQIEKNDKGEYAVGEKSIAAEASGVSISLDGLVIGGINAGLNPSNTLTLPSGVHQMRFERADLIPYARMVNVSANTKIFSVYLRMSDAARERWKSDAQFFESLKIGAKLTDAQVKVLEGLAQTYKNSGFKIDYKTDTNQPITIQQNSSILPQPVIR